MLAVRKLSFGAFMLDLDTRLLTRRGHALHLSGKAFELLALLARERPKALSKDDLHDALWPSTFVAEGNLPNLIAEIRGALGDHARRPMFIRTLHRFGYAFCGEASAATAEAHPKTRSVACWIEWGGWRFPLAIGEHVIGRDEDADIRIDASTVSRRHARVIVNAKQALLEDFGSKNGTFRGEERVIMSTPLTDGDALRIGTVRVTFRKRSPAATTLTVSKFAD